MQRQFPLSFEFNEYFLHFVAYHHVSMRFRTFLLDSEHERHQMGWFSDDDCVPTGDKKLRKTKSRTTCLWEYIDELHNKSSLFFNFRYSKDHSEKVGVRYIMRFGWYGVYFLACICNPSSRSQKLLSSSLTIVHRKYKVYRKLNEN